MINGEKMLHFEDSHPLNNAVPMYMKIYYILKEKIITYQLLPDESLPTENELCLEYNVSRQTIRNAIKRLEDEGLVIKSQGKPSHIRPLPSSTKAPERILTLGGINQKDTLLTQFHTIFAQKIFEYSGGKVQIRVEHSSYLGSGEEQITQVVQKEQEMFGAAIEWLGVLDSSWGITSIPFLFNDNAELRKFVQSDVNEKMKQDTIKKYGVRILADNWYRPSRILLSRTPCFNLSDLQGKRMAISAIPFYKKIWEELGTKPIECIWGEERKAFLAKKIDMTDPPLDTLLEHKLHKVAPYLTQINHLFSRAALIINEEVFQSFSPSLQNIFTHVANSTGELFSKKIIECYEENEERLLKEHGSITRINTKEFQKKVELILSDPRLHGEFPYDIYQYIKKNI